MKPGDEGEGEEGAALAIMGAVVGDELTTTDLPRSTFYPGSAELTRLTRGVAMQLSDGWRRWLEQTFALAREAREQGGRVAPAPAGSRAALLADLERRRPGTTQAAALMALLADDVLLTALVDAVTLLDAVSASANPVER